MKIAAFRLLSVLFFTLGLTVHSFAATPQLRVSAEQLANMMSQTHVLVIDARPAEAYNQGHIPSAVNIPFKKTFQDLSKNGLVLSSERAGALLQSVGLKNTDIAVIYDDSNMVPASRVFWMLDMYGHPKTLLLDGGLSAWQAQGGRLSTDTPKIVISDYRTKINPNAIKTWADVDEAIKDPNDFILIDARDGEHYAGQKSEAYRSGHIPGARNVPVSKNLTADGHIRPLDELKALYGDIPKDKQVIVYCSKGLASSLEYIVLRELGIKVGNYESSWMEWGNKLNLPIVNPSAGAAAP